MIATGFDHVSGEMTASHQHHLRSVNPTSVVAATAGQQPTPQQQQQQENVSFYRKAAGQTPGGSGGFPFDDRDDLDIPTFKRKM